jgi:hypothetical protein
MLTEDDLKAIANLLETYGLRKPPSAAALRQQRYRERQKAGVTGRNESVTQQGARRHAASQKRNGVRHAAVDDSPVVITFLLNDGSEFEVRESIVKEFEQLYPQCDVPQTLREIKGWCLANQPKRKTRAGALKFVNGWLAREQNKG